MKVDTKHYTKHCILAHVMFSVAFRNWNITSDALRSVCEAWHCGRGKLTLKHLLYSRSFSSFFCAWAVFLPFQLKIISLNIKQL